MDGELRDRDLIVVSDLHLGDGRDPLTGKFSSREDFFFDEQFGRFLAHYREPRRGSPGWHLIVNGDLLDILQVVTLQGATPSMNRDRDRPSYGLACGEQESAFKLARIAEGHKRFMLALAEFAAAGNFVTIIRGNHDVELHYPAVQRAFVDELQRAWASGGGSAAGAANIARGVRFSDWFYYEENLIWVEHGSQYQGLNAFRYWLSPLLPDIPGWPADRKDEIDLPLGSYFVRYLFNRVEHVEPFADNMKPATRFVAWFFRKRLLVALGFVIRDGSYMLSKIRRALRSLEPSAYDARKAAHDRRLAELASSGGPPHDKLRAVDALRARTVLQEPAWWARVLRPLLAPWCSLSLLFLTLACAACIVLLAVARLFGGALPAGFVAAMPLVLVRAVRERGPYAVLAMLVVAGVLVVHRAVAGNVKSGPSYLARRASDLARLLGVQYVVMGHTHDPELEWLGDQGGRALEYFNTGTWTKVFGDERDRILGEDVRFVFLEALREGDGLRVRLLQWNDGAGEPRLLELFGE